MSCDLNNAAPAASARPVVSGEAGETAFVIEAYDAGMAAQTAGGEACPSTRTSTRQSRPDELAFAVAFLCSERAGAITGSAIHIDAGEKMFG